MNKEDIIHQRGIILDLLYEARQRETSSIKNPIPLSDIEDATRDTRFNLGVLEELGWVERLGLRYRITAQGVLQAEADHG